MVEAAVDIYCDAFVARERHELDSDPVVLTVPDMRGIALIRVLVTDDAACDRLVTEAEGAWRGVVMVFERASRCNEVLCGQPGWSAHGTEIAMVLRDVQAVTGPHASGRS